MHPAYPNNLKSVIYVLILLPSLTMANVPVQKIKESTQEDFVILALQLDATIVGIMNCLYVSNVSMQKIQKL